MFCNLIFPLYFKTFKAKNKKKENISTPSDEMKAADVRTEGKNQGALTQGLVDVNSRCTYHNFCTIKGT